MRIIVAVGLSIAGYILQKDYSNASEWIEYAKKDLKMQWEFSY